MAVVASLIRQENSESLWIKSESIRLLMQSRRGTTGQVALNANKTIKRFCSSAAHGSVFKFRVPLKMYSNARDAQYQGLMTCHVHLN